MSLWMTTPWSRLIGRADESWRSFRNGKDNHLSRVKAGDKLVSLNSFVLLELMVVSLRNFFPPFLLKSTHRGKSFI